MRLPYICTRCARRTSAAQRKRRFVGLSDENADGFFISVDDALRASIPCGAAQKDGRRTGRLMLAMMSIGVSRGPRLDLSRIDMNGARMQA
jgi:hypothetical protein